MTLLASLLLLLVFVLVKRLWGLRIFLLRRGDWVKRSRLQAELVWLVELWDLEEGSYGLGLGLKIWSFGRG